MNRFGKTDIPSAVSKGVPEFCTVYIISKGGKIANTRSACRPAPLNSQLRSQIMQQPTTTSLSPPHSRIGFSFSSLSFFIFIIIYKHYISIFFMIISFIYVTTFIFYVIIYQGQKKQHHLGHRLVEVMTWILSMFNF